MPGGQKRKARYISRSNGTGSCDSDDNHVEMRHQRPPFTSMILSDVFEDMDGSSMDMSRYSQVCVSFPVIQSLFFSTLHSPCQILWLLPRAVSSM